MKINYCIVLIILLGTLSVWSQPKDITAYFSASWSPDGKYLAFTQSELKAGPPRSMKADIYIMKADGTGIRKITGDEKEELAPVWSRDGKRILFLEAKPGARESHIFSMKIDGTDLIQITNGLGINGFPKVSHNGKKIAFGSNRDSEKFQIYTMEYDGTNVTRLTNDSAVTFYEPVWSPSGKKIVYYVEKGDQKDQIWTMNGDGTNPQLLTGGIGHNFFPSWSADGKKIVFSGFREPSEDPAKDQASIYIMNADGSNLKHLGNLKGSSVSFSPDGKKIVFIGGKFPETGIYVANSDGTNVKKLIGN